MTDQKQSLDRLRNDLRSIEDDLTPREIFGLQQARNKALSQPTRSSYKPFWPAFSAILTFSFLFIVLIIDTDIFQPQPVDDSQNLVIDMLAYYGEDNDELDVYYWLAESEEDLDLLYGLAYFE